MVTLSTVISHDFLKTLYFEWGNYVKMLNEIYSIYIAIRIKTSSGLSNKYYIYVLLLWIFHISWRFKIFRIHHSKYEMFPKFHSQKFPTVESYKLKFYKIYFTYRIKSFIFLQLYWIKFHCSLLTKDLNFLLMFLLKKWINAYILLLVYFIFMHEPI